MGPGATSTAGRRTGAPTSRVGRPTTGPARVRPARRAPTGPAPRSHRRRRWPTAVRPSCAAVVVVVVRGAGSAACSGSSTRPAPGGPPGAQVIVTVPSGTGASQLAATLAGQGGDRQFAGLPDLEPVPRRPRRSSPARTPSTRTAASPPSTPVISAGPNVFPLDIPPGLHRGRGGRAGWASSPGTTPAAFAAVATGGTVRSPVAAGRLHQPRRAARAPASTWWCPARPTPQLLTAMVDRFDTPGRPGST